MGKILKKIKKLKKRILQRSWLTLLWITVLIGSLVIGILLYENGVFIASDQGDKQEVKGVGRFHENDLQIQALEIWNQVEQKIENEALDFEDINLLENAREKLVRFTELNIDYSTQELEIIDSMERLIHEFYAKPISEKIKELEEKANIQEKKDDFSGTIKTTKDIIALQTKINENYPKSKQLDYAKGSILEAKILKLKTLPLFLESQRLEKEGIEFMDNLQWQKALQAMQQAKKIQIEINDQYQSSSYFRHDRMINLEKAIQKITSSQEYFAMQALLQQANFLDSQGKHKESAQLFANLRDRQHSLNENYPQSSFVSSSMVLEYEQRRQTAESIELYQRILRNKTLIDQLLRLSDFDQALDLANAVLMQTNQFSELYPRSKLEISSVLEQVQFILNKTDYLQPVWNWVQNNLHPLDEEDSRMIATSEVPQFIYEIIMSENPSRHVGSQQPVDSVTWYEASTFCEKLSFVTGNKVRLPLVKEYRNIIQKNQLHDFTRVAWYSNNAKGVTQEIATLEPVSGLYDFWGNVSEWLIKDPSKIQSEVAELPYFLSNIVTIAQKPDSSKIAVGSGYERVRTRGFRFVVYKEKQGNASLPFNNSENSIERD